MQQREIKAVVVKVERSLARRLLEVVKDPTRRESIAAHEVEAAVSPKEKYSSESDLRCARARPLTG